MPSIICQSALSHAEKEDIRGLWNREYPAHLAHADPESFEGYLAGLGHPLHYLIREEQRVKAWLVTFDRDEARWFAMILDGGMQGKGLGSQLLKAAQAEVTELNGWADDHGRDVKADGKAYPSPIGFYLKNGFEVLHGTRFEKGEVSLVKIQWRR